MSNEKNHYGSGLGIAAGVLLAIYVFFPVAFVLPVVAAYKRDWISRPLGRKIAAVVIAPARFISDRFPAYERMVQAEVGFCDRLLPSP